MHYSHVPPNCLSLWVFLKLGSGVCIQDEFGTLLFRCSLFLLTILINNVLFFLSLGYPWSMEKLLTSLSWLLWLLATQNPQSHIRALLFGKYQLGLDLSIAIWPLCLTRLVLDHSHGNMDLAELGPLFWLPKWKLKVKHTVTVWLAFPSLFHDPGRLLSMGIPAPYMVVLSSCSNVCISAKALNWAQFRDPAGCPAAL